ncbi:MAG: Ig-like domain-containing protein, partial [Gemmatimonadaceae bacterium]
FTTTENTPPTILSTDPPNGATGVAPGTPVRIRFSERMNINSLGTRVFDVTPQTGEGLLGGVASSYDTLTNVQTLSFAQKSLHTYEVVVGWSFPATDLAGNKLATNASRFTTLDLGPPRATVLSPARNATDVDPATQVRITFSEPIDPATLTPSNFFLYASRTGGARPAGSISYDASTNTAIFTPEVPLANATWYGVFLANIRDATGVPMEDPVNYEFLLR